MDNSSFIEMLRDAKILSKLDITAHYATMIFREHAIKQVPPKRVNFTYFRVVLIPILAAKRKVSVNDFLLKLSHFEHRKHLEKRASALDMEETNEINMQNVRLNYPVFHFLLIELYIIMSIVLCTGYSFFRNCRPRSQATDNHSTNPIHAAVLPSQSRSSNNIIHGAHRLLGCQRY